MENWARAVPETDSTLLHLGDLSYKNNAWFKNLIAPHLTGERKLIIKGNHDHQRYSFFKQSGFKPARPFWIQWGTWRVEFSHYPYSVEHDGSIYPDPGTLRLHGHIHNNGYYDGRGGEHHYVPFLFRHINLSAEQTKYTPVNLQDLLDGFTGQWEPPSNDETDPANPPVDVAW